MNEHEEVPLHTPASVEAIPLGKYTFSLYGVDESWKDVTKQERLFEALGSIRQRFFDNKLAVGALMVRLYAFASDLRAEAQRWQTAVGHPINPSSNPVTMVAGMSISWGDGEIGTTYGVSVLAAGIAEALIDEDEALRKYSSSIVAHEMAHMHSAFLERQIFGKELYRTMDDDWEGLKLATASLAWEEYFAEWVASNFNDGQELPAHIAMTVSLLTSGLQAISVARDQYLIDGDMSTLWKIACNELSQISNQFGRILGQLARYEEQRSTFYTALNEAAPDWTNYVYALEEELAAMREAKESAEMFDELQELVANVFYQAGLFPEQRGDRLYIRLQ